MNSIQASTDIDVFMLGSELDLSSEVNSRFAFFYHSRFSLGKILNDPKRTILLQVLQSNEANGDLGTDL